jgi:PilZ domain
VRIPKPIFLWTPGKLRGAFLYRLFKILAYFDQMVETRIASRHRVLKAATIEFGGDSIDCVIRDLSTTGAKLEVSNQTDSIPSKFTLAIPGDALRLPCAVVWRSQYRMGVHFD